MSDLEKLKAIRAKCAELLELAEKRTPGEWRVQAEAIYANTGNRSEPIMRFYPSEQHHKDNAYIAACAGAAEAGWRSTITAIDGLLEIAASTVTSKPDHPFDAVTDIGPTPDAVAASTVLDAILAAWEGLI